LNHEIKNIGIVGTGGWGTAISIILALKGFSPLLWSFESATAEEITSQRTNSVFLNGVELPPSVRATDNLSDLRDSDIVVFAVPTQFIRSVLSSFPFDLKDKIVINLAKGIEKNTHLRVSQIFAESGRIVPENYLIMTGPSHAEEVALLTPTTIVAASHNHNNEQIIRDTFSTETFRVYSSDDVIGAEIGGALKNVIAIGAGIVDGLGLGDNTKAALITRGLAEMSRLGMALGAKERTFSGLAGLGDLYVTCASRHSRNRRVGEQVGKGRTLAEVLSEMKMIAEGVSTTQSAYELGKIKDIELPITEQVYKILFENVLPKDAISDLMNRETKREWW
jgi:glycerol-3-phosphate dehydrogenase (NAD(P)+)